MIIRNLFPVCALLFLLCWKSNAQPYMLIGGERQDQVFDMQIINGELILVGGGYMLTPPNIADAFVLKASLDLDSLQFVYHVDTTDTESYYSLAAINNQLFACGSYANYCCDSPSYNVAPLVRLDNDFSIDTVFRFGGEFAEVFYKLIPLDNHLYAFGLTQTYTTETSGENSNDPYVVKCDEQGNAIWEKHPGTLAFDNLSDACLDVNHMFFFTAGGTAQTGSDPYYNGYIIKLDTAGNAIWRKSFNTGFQHSEYLTAVTAIPDAGGVAAGYVIRISDEAAMPYLIRFDANGDTIWTKVLYRFNEPNTSPYNKRWRESEVWDVITLTSGDLLFTGDWYDADADTRDIFICKYSAAGDSLWRIDLGDAWSDKGFCVAEDNQGFIYVAGSYVNPNTTNGLKDVLLIKLDANGCTVDTCLVTAIHQPVFTSTNVFQLYPNPTDNFIRIEITNPLTQQDNELFIRDAIGRTVIHQGVSNNTTISLQSLTAGVYIAELKQHNGVRHFQRFVKQ